MVDPNSSITNNARRIQPYTLNSNRILSLVISKNLRFDTRSRLKIRFLNQAIKIKTHIYLPILDREDHSTEIR